MLGHLLRMVEWHARSVHGWGYDTWHGGKFIAEWADPRVYAELCETFAHLDVADGWRAMEARIELFHRLAREVAARLGLPYPGELGAHIAGYVDVLRQAEAGHSAPEERVF
jgi:aminoglycoside 6-adenylyltransferase